MSDASMSGEYDGSHETGDHSLQSNVSKQEDNYLPIAKIDQVMKRGVPANGKIARDAKEAVQECVSEFVSFITSEANDKCLSENRRTIDGDDILWAMANLGYEDYINPLKLYLNRYREMEGEKFSIGSMENSGRQTKKQRLVGNMNVGSEGRLWEDLDKDCLLTIYHKLELKDLLSGAPLCCSSWYKLSKDPSLWRHVNLYGFNLHKGKLVSPSQLVEFVVFRSEGSLTSITFPYHASVDDLLLVAERCPRLKHFSLRIPVSQTVLDKKTIFKAISKLQELEGMDVQDAFLSDFALRRIYRCCPNFTKLKVFDTLSNETASLVATLLPKLKTLDLSGTMPHRKNVLAILKGCEELESLDLTGCGKIYGSDEILKIGCKRLKEFKWDDKYNSSCSRCEEECDSDTEVCYEWPCVHVMDNGWSTYIDGTYELMDELHPPSDDGSDEHLPFVPDPPFAEEPSDCYCECG